MNRNVGSTERIIRLVGGVAAGAAAFGMIKKPWARALLGTIAASGITTAATRYCPMNALFGINRARDVIKDAVPELRTVVV